jgi:hypothetical protein
MRNVLFSAVVILAVISQGCGNDHQLDPKKDGQLPSLDIDSNYHRLATPDLPSLLTGGIWYQTPFVLDLALPMADLVFLERGSVLEASLREDGFDGPLVSLAVTSNRMGDSSNVLLHIRTDGIFDGQGSRLVDQVPALYGYAWRIGTSSMDAVFPRISFVSVILLDENGAGASDELYIYWKQASGTRGSFTVTNIPNEIM